MAKPDSPSIEVAAPEGKTIGYAAAKLEIDPAARHALIAHTVNAPLFSGDSASAGDCNDVLGDVMGAVASGDLSIASRTLTAQALTLDALFTQLTQRALVNMGEYPEAMERYMRLALKAQGQSRTTLEALVKLHQPREQTVRHVHVGPNGQAVFIENLHGGMGNARISDQAHAQSSHGPALLGHDAGGNGVPVPGGAREEAVPDARGRGRKRRTDRQP